MSCARCTGMLAAGGPARWIGPRAVGTSRAAAVAQTLPTWSSPAFPSRPHPQDRQVSDALASGQSLYTLDEHLIRALAPDVILTQDICTVCAIDLVTVERLCATMEPRPSIVSLDPMSLGDVLHNLTQIGQAVGLEREAAAAVAHLEERIARARASADAAVAARGGFRPNVAFVEWPSPLYVGGHWTPQLLRLAGAEHPLNPAPSDAEGAGKSFPVSMQALAESRPDLVVVAPCGLDLEGCRREVAACLHSEQLWQQLGAVKAGRVALVDGDAMFNRPGPRLVDALEWLVWLLHSDASPIRPGSVRSGAEQEAVEAGKGAAPPAGFAWSMLDSAQAEARTLTGTSSASRAEAACLDMEDAVASAHSEAVRAGKLQYADPATGYLVFTELASLGRGYCCGNACRHCPYGHVHAPQSRRRAQLSRSLLLRAARDAPGAALSTAAWREASALLGMPGGVALQLVAFDGSDLASQAFATLREQCAATLPLARSQVEPLAVCFVRGGACTDQLALGSKHPTRAAMDAANELAVDLLAVVVPPVAAGECDTPAAETARALAALRLALRSCVPLGSGDNSLAVWLPACMPQEPKIACGSARERAFPLLGRATTDGGHPVAHLSVEIRELLVDAA